MVVWQVLLIILAVLLGMIGLCAGVIWLERKYPTAEYDERQKQARGNGYRLSFWVGIAYFLGAIFVMMQQMDAEKKVEPYLLSMAGVLLVIMVDHTYCVLTHSDLPLSKQRIGSVLFYAAYGLTQLGQFLIGKDWMELSWVGNGSKPLCHLMMTVCSLYLMGLHIIQFLRERKE